MRPSASVVLRDGRRHRDGSDLDDLADVHLGDLCEAAPAHRPAHPARNDDLRIAAEQLERRKVEVIPVRMRDERGIDVAYRLEVDAPAPSQVEHSRAKHRIGEQANPVELEKHRRMPDVGDPCGNAGAQSSALSMPSFSAFRAARLLFRASFRSATCCFAST